MSGRYAAIKEASPALASAVQPYDVILVEAITYRFRVQAHDVHHAEAQASAQWERAAVFRRLVQAPRLVSLKAAAIYSS